MDLVRGNSVKLRSTADEARAITPAKWRHVRCVTPEHCAELPCPFRGDDRERGSTRAKLFLKQSNGPQFAMHRVIVRQSASNDHHPSEIFATAKRNR